MKTFYKPNSSNTLRRSLLLFFIAFSPIIFAQTQGPEFKFDEENFDFGNIKQGDKISHDYVFTNSGNSPIFITEVKTECGCTVPDWPKQPILPGKSGVINVIFNSEGKTGVQEKEITILSNVTGSAKVLHLSGSVD